MPSDKSSGLLHAASILQGIDNISVIRLKNRDIVRNDLVQAIVKAYEESKNNQEKVTK
ncbi:MAG: PhoH family protein [Clostridia bacterium]|nr:PhoH family protein [Clostridia bacterium]